MADERIDIEITDKVDDNIERKIIGIAKASDKGHTSVQKLKAALKDINTTAVSKLAAASNSATNALAREMNATAKLTIARSREAESTARVALQTQKLATEQAKTAAATLRAQAASDRASASKAKEASASAALTAELAREANAKNRVIRDRTDVTPGSGANLGGIGGSRQLAGEQTNAMRRSTVQPADIQMTNDLANANVNLNDKLNKTAAGAGLARHQMVNLGYQLQDVFVSLQAGQAPLTVLIQQGSQIAGIAAASGVGLRAMTAAVWGLIAPFTPLIAVLAAAYFGFKQFTENSAAKHKPELEAYAKTLDLTSKEMRKLQNETVGAGGKLNEFDTITITSGQSFRGFIMTVKEGLAGTFAPIEGVTNYFATAWDYAVGFAKNVYIGFHALVVTLVKTTGSLLVNVVKIVGNTAALIANSIVMVVQDVLNAGVEGINLLLAGYNAAQSALGFDKPIAAIKKFDLGIKSVTQNMKEFDVIDIGATLKNEVKNVTGTIERIGDAWDRNNLKIAKSDLLARANAIKANRNPKAAEKPKVDKTAENRAHALGMVNEKLDDELARMKLLKPEREIMQRYDQITNDLLQKKIKLNDAEKASIMGKVRAIEAYKFVQAESDRIYEDAVAPLRTYNSSLTAAKDLLGQSAISQAQFNAEVNKAERLYAEATDPLFAMKEAMEGNVRAAGLYGQQVERNSYAEEVRQAFLSKGIDLTKNATAADLAAATALIAKNDALMQQQFLQSQVGGIVNPMLEAQQTLDAKAAMYAEIDRLRQTDVLSEQQAQQARYALDAKFSELRLANMSSTFGELAKLSASGNAELAAIGKAAAVAQATMDGYVAVQKALASGPPPFNFIQAAAVGVMTGVQVAGILSTNVGSFAQGGAFMVDGRAGVDNNNINMNVSRGERVTVETPAQQRAGAGGENGMAPALNVKVVNVTDAKDIEASLADPNNDYLILNALRRNPAQAKQLLGSKG